MTKSSAQSFVTRPAQANEVATAARIIADSFGPVEPYFVWLFPKAEDRARASLPLVQHWAEQAFQEGSLIVAVPDNDSDGKPDSPAGEVVGAALWHVENEESSSQSSVLVALWDSVVRTISYWVSSLLATWSLLGKDVWRYYLEGVRSKRARGNGAQCYLSCLAVSSDFRGCGVAGKLLASPPHPDLPLTLECREELVDFYAHMGFVQGSSYRLPGTATMVSFARNS